MSEYEKDIFDIICEAHRRKNRLCLYGIKDFSSCETQCKVESTCPLNPIYTDEEIKEMIGKLIRRRYEKDSSI